jgi:hypothetical protein
VRTPGVCVIADRAQGFAAKLGEQDELIIISRLVYGGPSPDIKAFLDRCIPYLLPYFEVEDGMMRHKQRYSAPLSLRYYYYVLPASEGGPVLISSEEIDLMERISRANAKNLRARNLSAEFVGSVSAVGSISL